MPMAIAPRPSNLRRTNSSRFGNALTNLRAWKPHWPNCTRSAQVKDRCRDARLSKRSPAIRPVRIRLQTRLRSNTMSSTMEKALKDPVCGMAVTPDSKHFSSYRNQTWYFCSDHCKQRFEADPQAILDGSHKNGAHSAQGGSDNIYTCPMHPEVRQQGPGDCPDCGMALEPE